MKHLFCLSVCLFVSTFLFAQQQGIKPDWLVSAALYYSGGSMIVNDIASGNDGAVITVGSFSQTVDFDPGPDTFNLTAADGNYMFLAKYSKTGKLVFAYAFGSGNATVENAYTVTVDNDDNIYMAGIFSSTIDFNPGIGTGLLSAKHTEIFTASYSKNGAFRHAVQVTNSSADIAKSQTPSGIAVDEQHNVYLTGVFNGKADFDPGEKKAGLTSAGSQDIFFAKYDSAGHYLFAKSIGGTGYEVANKMILDKKGNIVLCGSFSSPDINFNPEANNATLATHGKGDIFFAKYDNNGNYIFAKQIGGGNDENALSVAIGTDNSIILTGFFSSKTTDFDPGNDTFNLYVRPTAGSDAFIARYTDNGDFVFAANIAGSFNTQGNDIAVDQSNNIFITGTFTGTVDFDPSATQFLITANHDEDIFIAEYTDSAALLFANQIGNKAYPSAGETLVKNILVNKQGEVIIAGSYSDTLDVNPSEGVVNLIAAGLTLFVAKYAPATGAYIASISAGNYNSYSSNTPFASVQALSLDEAGNVYITGLFRGRYDFDPGPGTYLIESNNSSNNSYYFAKYDTNRKLLFAKAITGGQVSTEMDIKVDKEQNIYLCGVASNSTDFDPSDSLRKWDFVNSDPYSPGHFFAKYSSTGNLILAKGFGADYYNRATALAIDNQHNIYVTGYFGAVTDFDAGAAVHSITPLGYYDIYLSKYDASGNYVFAYNMGSADGFNKGLHIAINSKNHIVLSGALIGNNIDFNPGEGIYYLSSINTGAEASFIASYKNDGSFISAFALRPGDKAAKDYYSIFINSLVIDSSDNIYIAGDFGGKINFALSKDTFFVPSPSGLYMASYTAGGALRFAEASTTSTYNTTFSSLALDKNKNICAAGYFASSQIDCDLGTDTAFLINEHPDETNFSHIELFLSRYDSSGNYIDSYNFEGDTLIGANFSTAIGVDKNDNIFYGGYGHTKIDFDAGPDTLFLPITKDGYSSFLVKYAPSEAGNQKNGMLPLPRITRSKTVKSLFLYPNPAADHVFITIKNITEFTGSAHVVIYNPQGILVISKSLLINDHTIRNNISLQGLLKGMYFIIVSTTGKTYSSSLSLP